MDADLPAGWERDSETLYLHSSGVRIERRIYRNRDGWVLVPVDLDRAVLEFAPDDAGLEKAFAAFAGGALTPEKGTATPEIVEAREAARRDEKAEELSEDDKEEDEETES